MMKTGHMQRIVSLLKIFDRYLKKVGVFDISASFLFSKLLLIDLITDRQSW